MAGALNKVMLIGHLGKDPETRRLGNGDPVVSLRLATSETWKDKATGERKEATEWHSVVIFNTGLCDIVERYCRKGSQVYVEGALKTRKWQDQSGAERYSTEIVLGRFNGAVTLLGKADRPAQDPDSYGTQRSRDDVGGYAGAKGGMPTAGTRPSGASSFANDLDDDIPF